MSNKEEVQELIEELEDILGKLEDLVPILEETLQDNHRALQIQAIADRLDTIITGMVDDAEASDSEED